MIVRVVLRPPRRLALPKVSGEVWRSFSPAFDMRSRLSLLVVAACPLTALPAQRARPAFARVDSAMLAELERSRTPGGAIAIVSGNRIVYANGYGRTAQAGGDPVTSATLFRIESVTKLFTAAAMLQLAEQGRVDLRSALGSTVGNIPAPIQAATPHQLLSHTAGLQFGPVPDGGPDPAVALREAAVRVIPRVAFTTPGEVFSYSNVGYLLAGRLIEVAAGRRYDQQIGAALLAPLGMVSSTFDPAVAATAALAQGTPDSGAVVPPPSAAMWPIAGLHSSVDELSHFAIAFLDDGLYRGRRVLSRESVARIATPVASFQSGEGDYGYGVRVYRHRGLDVVEHGGTGQDGYRAVLYMVPARRVAVIVLANRAGRRPYEVVDVALDAVVPGLPAAPAPRVSDTPLPGDMEEYVGSYVNGVALQVSVDDGVLVLHQGAQALPIRRTDDGRLVAIGEQGPAWIAFVRGPDRRVKYLHYNMRAFRRQQ